VLCSLQAVEKLLVQNCGQPEQASAKLLGSAIRPFVFRSLHAVAKLLAA
jgi:hypothetical protein